MIKNNIGLFIVKLIIGLILHIIMCPLTILLIFYFGPNFILIVFHLTFTFKNLIMYLNKIFSLPLYIIQAFALLIYIEIIELNFCGLNNYTKRNTELRAREDLLDIDKDKNLNPDINCIDIDNDYGIEFSEKNENEIESEKKLKEPLTNN